MQYVVCYDIADDGRRNRVATALLNFGKRIQESVFVAHLDERLAAAMIAKLGKLVERESDRVHVFALCGACEGKMTVIGQAEAPVDADYYLV